MVEYGDEIIQIVAVDQPFCTRTYSVAPCTAALGTTGTRKCYNSRATCQDPENYLPETLTLNFSRPQEGIEPYGYVLPSLDSLKITPLKINIGAMDRGLSPFGQREVVSITLEDHQHSDLLVDKYRLERPAETAGDVYDPYQRGTFWGKWIARNPYSEGYPLRVYDGVVGQSLAEMQVRHYLIDKVSGPNDGSVTITAKDLFTKVEGRKAKAPVASKGELSAAITAAATSATLAPTGIGDLEYPASGHVVIGDEAIAFTRSGDVLTLTRGALNTVAAAHADEDKVQVVLSYVGQSVHTIVNDLLVNYASVDSANIPLTTWEAEVAANLTNLYTAYITEPTDVSKLVGELAEQAGFSIWPDVQTNLINLKAIVPGGSPSTIVDDDAWIVAESLSIKPVPEQRVSQVWHYFGQVNPVKKLDETSNYRSRVIVADLNAEDTTQYGTASVKEIFSRWIPQFGRSSATQTGDRILSIFRDPPFRASFTLYADRDGQLSLATPFGLETDEVQDDTGIPLLTTQVPIKLIREEDLVKVESQRLKFFTPPNVTREIFIDNDTLDVNLRTAHDQLYAAPVSGDTVKVYIHAVVGSSSTGTPALQTGDWPTGVIIEVYIYTDGRAAGKGGAGGSGGQGGGDIRSPGAGAQGNAGGLAFKVTYAIKVYNGNVIAGGGGGGGGGGAFAEGVPFVAGGGGGGGGAGRNGGTGGAGGDGDPTGDAGSPGQLTTGGAGGSGNGAGDGGAGGAPALTGSAGQDSAAVGGAGGPPGAAIEGITNISWIDVDGNSTTEQGTILGTTS